MTTPNLLTATPKEASSSGPRQAGTPRRGPTGWRLGRLLGIPIEVHPTFALLLAWVAFSHVVEGRTARGVLTGVLLVVSVFACVVLHELSHALVARHFGVRTQHILLLPIGGVAHLERMPNRPRQELAIAIAGPLATLAIAVVLSLLASLVGQDLRSADADGAPFLVQLMWINVGLAVFHLLPAFPMDGGRVFRALLSLRLAPERATELAARLGRGFALLLGAVGVLFNPLLVLIAVFIWLGAKSEAAMAEVKALLRRVPVSEAMVHQFRVLAPDEPLAAAAEVALAGFQQDFPVVEGEQLVGVLTRANLLGSLRDGGGSRPVASVMERDFETASPWEALDVAFERLQSRRCAALVVMDKGVWSAWLRARVSASSSCSNGHDVRSRARRFRSGCEQRPIAGSRGLGSDDCQRPGRGASVARGQRRRCKDCA